MIKQKKWFIPALIGVLILLAGVAGYFLSKPQGNELPTSLQISPEGISVAGASALDAIPTESTFRVQSAFSVQEADLRALLEIEPPIEYKMTGSAKSWQLLPETPLSQNTVYTFRVKNSGGEVVQSFAFQTKSDLLIESTYPTDGDYVYTPNAETSVSQNTTIEVRFNAPDVDLSGSFELLPDVAGRFETHDHTAVFIPAAPLLPDSIYRVTIKAGLSAPSGIALKEDYSFSFETAPAEGKDAPDPLRLSGSFVQSALPGDAHAMTLRVGGESLLTKDLQVKIYKFPGINSFSKEVRAYHSYYDSRYGKKDEYAVDTSSLELAEEYKTPLLQGESGDYFVPLPATLSEGQYVVTTSEDDKTPPVQMLLQLANVSVYTQSTGGDTLVWLNDPVTGSPMPNTRLTLEDMKTGSKQDSETQEDGTAQLMTGKQESSYLTVTRDGSSLWFDRVSLSKETPPSLEDSFYSALYTDRELYQPDDTVRFWGVVRPRHLTSNLPESVWISLRTGWPEGEAARVKVPVGADGSFSGELSLSGLAKAYYTLCVTAGEEESYYTKSLEIRDYSKPAYRVTVTPDKDFFYYQEKVSFAVSAAYFDGTPVKGGLLRMNGSDLLFENGAAETEFALDEKGKATVKATLMPRVGEEPMSWEPTKVYYQVLSAEELDSPISQSGTLTALPSKLAVRLQSETPDTLTIEAAKLDTGKLSDSFPQPYPVMPQTSSFEQYRGAPENPAVTVLVHKVSYTRTQVGSYYDSVNKVTVPTYNTDRTESIMKTLKGTLSGGSLTFRDLPYENTEDAYYWFDVRFNGEVVGEVRARQEYIPVVPSPDREARYSFFGRQGEPVVPLGGTFEAGLYNNGVPVKNEGRVLCTIVQRRVMSAGIYSEDTHTLTLEPDDLPGIWLAGAYFDGRRVYVMRPEAVRYDYGEKTLQLSVTSDKPSYRPGDTAKLTLSVTDQAGKPAAASACIGVVDEAVFALQDQSLELVKQLYDSLHYPSIYQSVSFDEQQSLAVPNTGGMGAMSMDEAGMMGGGGNAPRLRESFTDTALFQTVEVPSGGKATVSLKLPDNVTGWRFTAAAVTQELSAGDTLGSTAATLPFYLTPLLSERYLEGDDIVLSAGAAGDAVKPEDKASYTLLLSDSTGKELAKKTASGAAGERTPFNLGAQPIGSYSLTLTGEAGGKSDAVKQSFSVIGSGITVPVYQSGLELFAVKNLAPARYPVQVTVYNEALKAYMEALTWLGNQQGERTEKIAAAYRAQVHLNALLPPEEQETVRRDTRLDTIQTEEGGVRALPAAAGDAATTTKLLLASPELVKAGSAKTYLQSVLSDPAATPHNRVMAYAGLAALKEPVLLDLNRLLEQDTLSAEERLYLGAGLARLGDLSGAQALYESVTENLQKEGALRYLEGDGTLESRIDTTAAALTLNAYLQGEDTAGYAAYLLGLQSGQRGQVPGEPFDLALLTWCEQFLIPEAAQKGKFSYTDLEGALQEVSLPQNGMATVSLSATQLESLKPLSGKLFASASYLGAAKPIEDPSHKLTVEKTYTPIGGGEKIHTGDRVRVDIRLVFDESAPEGCYNLTDYLPSGLRYLPDSALLPLTDTYTGTLENEGQTIRGTLYRQAPALSGDSPLAKEPVTPLAAKVPADTSGTSGGEKPIPQTDGAWAASPDSPVAPAEEDHANVYTFTYYAAAVLPGSYVSESVYVTPYRDGVFASSPRSALQILE